MILERLIGIDEDGKDVRTILKQGFKVSNRLITRLKNHQGIHVNGKPVFTNYVCHEGDVVTIDLAIAEPVQNVIPEHGELDILYEDEYVLAVYKPEGMITHPSRSQFEGTLMGFALGYLSLKDIHSCHALNRLDRYTSGIVLFTKNSYSKALFTPAMQHATKEYVAVTFGKTLEKQGTIDLPIDRLQTGIMLRGVTKDGARAVTHYAVMKEEENISVLRLTPETGRTHQLRVHCLALGVPIVGDQLYYTEESRVYSDSLKIHGQLLHAERLRFTHPVTNEQINIHCKVIREPMQSLLVP